MILAVIEFLTLEIKYKLEIRTPNKNLATILYPLKIRAILIIFQDFQKV